MNAVRLHGEDEAGKLKLTPAAKELEANIINAIMSAPITKKKETTVTTGGEAHATDEM